MQVKTQSCVVADKKTVAVTEQTIDWNNNGTLVQITRGGICGSDLHYYQEGKVGNFMIKAPMVLGHEVIGKVIHSDSSELHEGQTVAINPSKPCGHCKYCIEHNENQCTDMRFLAVPCISLMLMVVLPVIKWSKRRNVSLIRPKLTKRLWLLPNL